MKQKIVLHVLVLGLIAFIGVCAFRDACKSIVKGEVDTIEDSIEDNSK